MNFKTTLLFFAIILGNAPSIFGMQRARTAIKNFTRTAVREFSGSGFTNIGSKSMKHAGFALGAGTALAYGYQTMSTDLNIDDVTDTNSLISLLQSNQNEDKQVVIQEVAKHIKDIDLEAILKSTSVENIHLISTTIAKNINNYEAEELTKILLAYQAYQQAEPYTFICDYQHYALELILMQASDATQERVAELLTENCTRYTGSTFKQFLLLCNLELKQSFLCSMMTQHFAELIEWLNERTMPSFKEQCTIETQLLFNTLLKKQLSLIIMKGNPYSIHSLLELCNSKNQEILYNAVLQNIKTNPKAYTKDEFCAVFLTWQEHGVNNLSPLINTIIHAMDNDPGAYSSDEFSTLELLGIMYEKANQQDKETIICFIEKHVDVAGFIELKESWERENPLKELEKLFSKDGLERVNNSLIQKLKQRLNLFNKDSQSARHLEENALASWENALKIINNDEFRDVFKQALHHEQNISNESAVFYHSQRSPVYWLEILYTKLWERKYNKKNNNYLFVRFPDDVNDWSNAVLQSDGQEKRKNLLKLGRTEDQAQAQLRPYLFFVNYALFGNASRWGSCSTHYFINSWNVSDPSITSEMILANFGDDALFQKYRNELELIETEFKALIPNSVLVQLILPYQTLQDHVYLAAPGGFKKTLNINGKETDNVKAILQTLKETPTALEDSDRQEFCVVMTPDSVHTLREQGAEMRIYGTHDQEKLDQLIQKLEILVDKIATENANTFAHNLTPTQSYTTYKNVIEDLVSNKT